MRYIAVLAVLTVLLIACAEPPEMPVRHVFSRVTGVVTDQGQPVEGAELVRSWYFPEADPQEDRATTAADGSFEFPALTAEVSMLKAVVPMQPIVFQRIVVRHDGEEYVAYDHMKDNYDENGEADGRSLDFICSLQEEEDEYDFPFGICRFRTDAAG